MLAFKNAEGKVVEQVTGVPIRIKPYRLLWGRNEEGKLRPKCGSLDHEWGEGNPGGHCDVCALAEYQGRDADNCRSKTRLYLVGRGGDNPEPAVFDLTAMCREGLEPLSDWCLANDWPLYQTVIRLSLEPHPRQMGEFRSALAKVTLVGVLPGDDELDEAMLRANAALELMERSWLRDLADWASPRAGGDYARFDSTRHVLGSARRYERPVLDEPAVRQAPASGDAAPGYVEYDDPFGPAPAGGGPDLAGGEGDDDDLAF